MSPTALLLAQLIVILLTARLFGWVLRYFGQPSVIGEMVAGLVLGPVAFGALFPDLHAQLFPKASLGGLTSLSTLGLVLFMFVVGLETKPQRGLGAQIRAAGLVGLCSVITPVLLGFAITPFLYRDLAPAGIGYWPFSVFVAAALSVTAFPVMARILKDRGLTQTRLGQLALNSAAVVDVFAWILVALVVEVVHAQGSARELLRITLGVAALIAALVWLVRPLLARLLARHAPQGELTAPVLATLIAGLLGSALVTDWLQLHAVFGAYLFGALLPRDEKLTLALTRRIEPLAIIVLMPLFFALAGLGTTTAAFTAGKLMPLCLIVAAATVGKIAGGALGARLSGYGWRDSVSTGALMNARGLMELVIMKIGLDAGVIGPPMFTMLLVMALATTAMTGPVLALVQTKATRVRNAEMARPD
jgi:Kef-type K+ transport system membrane component KefB